MGYKLIAEEGALEGMVLTFEEGKEEWILGRDPEQCTLVVESPKVSRQHAHFRKKDDSIEVENLSHTNPIAVNDAPLTAPQLLHVGDRLKIGGIWFRFAAAEAAVPPISLSIAPQVSKPQEESFETILKEAEESPGSLSLDLSLRERWLLKVVAGPQTGAEFSMAANKTYFIGSDATVCDIIFYDLSVSRRHASITLSPEGACTIEDLDSRNGVIVNNKPIQKQAQLQSQDVISLGTTSFIIIDREKASETIISAAPQPPPPAPEPEPPITTPEKPPEHTEEPPAPIQEVPAPIPPAQPKPLFSTGTAIIGVALLALLCLIGAGLYSLFSSSPSTTLPQPDYNPQIKEALKDFPSLTYNFSPSNGNIFLYGHVLTLIEKAQMQYNLQQLPFIQHIDDANVVVDQLIWQETNALLSRNPAWNGVSIHAIAPGSFVVTGYLKTRPEMATLNDYLSLNFPYMDRLQNRVVVEEDLRALLSSQLISNGFNGIALQLNNGEVSLSGFFPSNAQERFQELLASWKTTPGVRIVKNFAVPLAPADAIVDLSDRYHVTGFSSFDHKTINVVINGHILSRGDAIDGMTITSIQPNVIYLEKGGLKYKITYNT